MPMAIPATPGPLTSCEHSVTRRVVRTEKNGNITVLADRFEGKRLNAPNDVGCSRTTVSVFTDPLFGINGEGRVARHARAGHHHQCLPHQPRRQDCGRHHRPRQPQRAGLSPDEKKLYVVEWKARPIAAWELRCPGRRQHAV